MLGGPIWLNDAGHAAALIEAGELPSRPPKHKALTAQGVLDYMVTGELRAQVRSARQGADVEAEAELKPDEHNTVKISMTDQPVGARAKKAATKTPQRAKFDHK